MSESSGPQEPDPIPALEREILEYVAKGININSWLMDALGNIDGVEFQRLINRLIADGYVRQRGGLYLDKVTYELTEEGRDNLPPLSERDRSALAEYGLDYDSIATLDCISRLDEKTVRLEDVASDLGTEVDYQKVLIEKLAEDGYIAFRGMLVPKITLTDEGEAVARRFQHRDW